MADGTQVLEHPAVQAARLRAGCEKAVDRLLAMLDALGPDTDLEPSLGGLNATGPYGDQRRWADGLGDDLEEEHDGCEPPEDPEDILGRSENIDQVRREYGQDDREPSLGSTNPLDQREWAAGNPHAALDGEVESEDEGAACEDEGAQDDREPDEGHSVPDYADDGHDQTRLANVSPDVKVSPLGAR
jgi:hypothetical protein